MAKEIDFDDYKVQNLRYPVTNVTGSYSDSIEDYVIISSGNSVTLPMASSNPGRLYIIKSTNVAIDVGVLLPIPVSDLVTVTENTCKHIISDGSTWVDITPG